MTDRKAELAKMCRVEIRKASAISKSRLADYGYHLAESVIDVEIAAMLGRLTDKSVRSDDIAILRELVIADLWPRLRESHAKQRDAAVDALIADFPDVVVHYANFAFDIGWIPLVRDACERMRTYPKAWKIRLDGGKEKFGCCDLHVSCVVAERGAMAEVKRLREEVRLRSLATCDICGGQGRLRLGGYAKTVCDKHSAIFECFREDDGLHADPWRWHHESDVPVGIVGSDVSRQIEHDIADRNREAVVLRRMASHIEAALAGAIVSDEEDIRWIRSEVERWRNDFPLSEDEAAWLRTYVRSLAIDELGRRHAADGPEQQE